MTKSFRITSTIFLTFLCNIVSAQIVEISNAAELQLALEKLNVLGSVLYVGAHPDDENTGLMAYFSKAKKYRTAYLSLTRGDGGQNLIGSEKGVEIGIIRTQELLEARKIDGGEQFFTRAIDFGYSKSADESMQIWGRDSVFADVVWVIRKFRPDVIITRFPPGGNGGHGHHTASAILAREAFTAAADPKVFPEQLKYLKPWQAKRIFWNSYRFRDEEPKGLIGINTGEYNPLLGKSYTEIAAESRSMHKSQGFGSSPNRGDRMEYFQYVAGDTAKYDIFEGINTDWSRIDNYAKISESLNSLTKNFNSSNPSASLKDLLMVYSNLNDLDDNPWVDVKKKELLRIIKYASGLWMEAAAEDYSAAPGDQVKITTTVINRGGADISIEKIEFPSLDTNSSLNAVLELNKPFVKESIVSLPDNYPISQPYWLRNTPYDGLFNVTDQRDIGKAQNAPTVPVNISINYDNQIVTFTIPVMYKWNDRVEGELSRSFYVYPPVTVNTSENVAVFNNQLTREMQLTIKAVTPDVHGEIHLHTSGGWQVSPAFIPFSLKNKYDEHVFTVRILPPSVPGESILSMEVNLNNKIYSAASTEISYSHIDRQVYFPESRIKLVKLDLKKPDALIGYIMGSGDDIPVSLHNLGYNITILTDLLLERTDLSRFDVIISGIRAYNTRERLKYVQNKLMNYVKEGGTYIVQYNTPQEMHAENLGPYPFSIGRGRVSVEEASVNFLLPEHQLFNYPNKITPDDFNGWIQERGLYFADSWDQNYDAVLSSNDPGEDELEGGMLFTRYGKGVFIYSGLSWFRQIPAGVPGAYKLFVNMISAGKYERAFSN